MTSTMRYWASNGLRPSARYIDKYEPDASNNDAPKERARPEGAMAKSISRFFSDLGLPLNNIRWSWGARSADLLLLRTWADEFKKEGDVRRVTVLRDASGYRNADSYGLDERYRHLEALWAGGVAGYTVIGTVIDPAARPREIKDYRDDGVFSIDRLELRADGSLAAVLGALVPLKELAFAYRARSLRLAAAVLVQASCAAHQGRADASVR